MLTFYHPETLLAITNLRSYLLQKEKDGNLDHVDAWIRMVATNRLTGHSRGFFSVYTLPPNQAVSVEAQRKINKKRSQTPPVRDVREIIMRKSRSLLRKLQPGERSLLRGLSHRAKLVTASAEQTPQIACSSVKLVVTSPPFLDIVAYAQDNWLRCWFNGIDPAAVKLWHFRKPAGWQEKMVAVFKELKRILVPGGMWPLRWVKCGRANPAGNPGCPRRPGRRANPGNGHRQQPGFYQNRKLLGHRQP